MTDVLTIDFETYYDQQYSLSKMTTEEYIRDPRFETIGVCVKKNDGYGVWFSGNTNQTRDFLNKFDWANSIALAHNAMFDMAILNWVYDIRPKRIADTLSMARALDGPDAGNSLAKLAERYGLGAKGTEVVQALGKCREDFSGPALRAYGNYCRNDADLTYELFKVFIEKLGFPATELKLIDLTIRMFTEPVLELEQAGLMSHLAAVQAGKDVLLRRALVGKDDLMSNPKMASILRNCGVEPPMKISVTTGKETYAFAKSDEAFKALLEHEHPVVQAVVAARLGVKSTLEETRTQRFIDISKRGPLPIPLRYYAAHTGRWGGDDKVNMQNLPRKSRLKYAIRPPEGFMFLDSDSSQIEARTLAWLAEQDDLVSAFEKGEDVYKIMASAIYGKATQEIDADERFVGKTTILGSGYGMGAPKFQAQLKTFGVDIPLDECQRIIETYRETYPCIPRLWREAQQAIIAMANDESVTLGRDGVLSVEGKDGIRLPNGLYLHYPNLRRWQNEETGKVEYVYDTKKGKATIPNRIYGGKLVENICQALARIVIGEQMLMVAKKYRVVMTVHDAIGSIVPVDERDRAKEFVELCMRLRPQWGPDLPLNCEAGYGLSYGDCK